MEAAEAGKIIPMALVPGNKKAGEQPKPKGGGHVKIHRSLKDHWLWKASPKKSKAEAWIYLLMMAQWEDKKEPVGNTLVLLKKGQLLTSQETLSKAWLWERKPVRNFLQMLADDGMISLHATPKYTVITICNYASYHEVGPSAGQQRANEGPTKGHIQELKELEEEKLNTDIQEEKPKPKPKKGGKGEQPQDAAPKILLPWPSETFAAAWAKWKTYKKEQHSFTYKGTESEQAAINELLKLSGGDEQHALDLIDYAIVKTWKGFYPIKDRNTQSNATHQQPNPASYAGAGKSAGALMLIESLRNDLNGTTGG